MLVLALALMFAVSAIFFPWIYFAGGHWHALPEWRGWGHFTADGGEYALFVRMMPGKSGTRMYLTTALSGDALLCTPEGQSLRLGLHGGMAKHLPLDVRRRRAALHAKLGCKDRRLRSLPSPIVEVLPQLAFQQFAG